MRNLIDIGLVLIIILLLSRRKKKSNTELCLIITFNNFKFKIYAMEFKKNQFVNSTLGLIDSDTGEPIDATFENIVIESSDPSIVTADTDVNNDQKLDIVGISEGDASLTVKADVSYTDKNTGEPVTASKEKKVPITVSAPAPGAQNTELVVTLGTPEDVPTTT